jgi:hypothetical protein
MEIEIADDLEAMVDPPPKIEQKMFRKRIGNLKCYWHNKEGVPQIFIGPDYLYFSVILFLTVGFCVINIGIMYEMSKMDNRPITPFFITTALVLLGLYSVFKTFTANPGIPLPLL